MLFAINITTLVRIGNNYYNNNKGWVIIIMFILSLTKMVKDVGYKGKDYITMKNVLRSKRWFNQDEINKNIGSIVEKNADIVTISTYSSFKWKNL